MKPISHLLLALALTCAGCAMKENGAASMDSLYDIPIQTITGESTTLEPYRGRVLLIVNTASKCGFTGQYADLQALYEKYQDRGFVVLGFPSNDFLRQEPGTHEEIRRFCKLNYGVTFPLFAKIRVKGKDQHPLYHYLTSKQTNPKHGGKITWNFNKFLVSRHGDILARFGSRTQPQDQKLITPLETALQEPTP